MEIKVWDGGLQAQEVFAINIIKEAFSSNSSSAIQPKRGASIQDQLKGVVINNGMFPWKGYAGFRFVNAKGKEGEFDLVIITHCNVIIVELKDWHHKPVICRGDLWFKGNQNMGRSPVSITREKKFTLENKLKKLANKFTNKGFAPSVDFFVVMTGDSDFSALPEEQLRHTISLKEFLKFSDKNTFQRHFRPHPSAQTLNQDFAIFDKLFLGNQTKPKPLNFSGYEAKEQIFEHPKKVYIEYLASSEIAKSSEALLRVWQFNKLEGGKALTPEGRAEIVSREREILEHIHHQNRDLYNHCLRSLTSFQKSEITAEYCEVYELPPSHVRFNEFIGKYGKSFSDKDRLSVVKLLIAKFSDLHQIKIAHRDIADHSLWISPSKQVALSSFISAYHKPIGTVGDYRENLSVGAVYVADMLESESLTPFQQDVHALGLVAWHIFSGIRMSPKSLESVREDIAASESWYAPVVFDAIAGRYQSAIIFFDELKQVEPAGEDIPTFDDSELDRYRHAINHSRQYREDDLFIIETSDKEVYISNGYMVKAWLNVGAQGDDIRSNFNVLNFLQLIDKLCTVKPTYLPQIHDYGIASKSSSLYLVMDVVDGHTWDDIDIVEKQKLEVAHKLVEAVEHLHGLGVSHGDIHPKNVMLDRNTMDLYLIDIPDYTFLGGESKNHLYSPENIDGCTAFERDNFAVMKMTSELLDMNWGEDSDQFPEIAQAVRLELEDPQFGFGDLGRFKKSLLQTTKKEGVGTVEIFVGDVSEPFHLLPDNGRLYVKVEQSFRDSSEVRVTFNGVGGFFTATYSKERQVFVHCFSPRERMFISKKDEDESNFEINASIVISPGRPNDTSALSDFLNCNEAFARAVKLTIVDNDVADTDQIPQELKEAFELLGKVSNESTVKPSIEISTAKLWQAILDTEAESYPYVEVTGAVLPASEYAGELIVPYSSDVDPLGTFGVGDEVEALLVDAEGGERFIGEVSLKKSALNEIWLTKTRSGAFNLKENDTVFFRTRQDKASYRKRKAALGRLLDHGGVLPELIDLFDPLCDREAMSYGIEISEEDFARYDREDDRGNKISLNQQQRDAFSKLVDRGPLCLLQGPPGTGKTEFIAAFVHYLIEKMQVKRILLVSQSHEAVNTAAGRIRKHCKRLNTELEVVRFSNREGAVSDALKDVYSQAVTMEKRGLFEAEYKYRVEALGEALGLEPEFISSIAQAEFSLFKQIDNLQSLLTPHQSGVAEDDIEDLKKISLELNQVIRSKLLTEYNITLDQNARLVDAKELVISRLCQDYSVRPDEIRRARALAKISREMLDAWAGERVNCDEFYARSRQLVAGTCVGIGQGHIGIQNNIYDWVIIDEAARSIASELAIAMQCAKRVLLVGDHLQLPPLYSEAHKKALSRRLGITGAKEEIDDILQSDFARAFNSVYGQQVSSALLTQYRMAPPIGDLVSETFYRGKLKNGDRSVPDVYREAPDALKSVVTWLDTSGLGKRADHSDDRGVSIYNRCEADLLIDLLKQISMCTDFVSELSTLTDRDEAAIGVICMYSEQKKIIRQKFNQEIWSDGFKRLVKIDTVDSYQGKENRVIIVSLTRSDRHHSPGFLKTPNRINVAMSRAMDRLLIVGNADMWKGNNKHMPLGQVVRYMSESGQEAGYKFIKVNSGGRQ